MENFAIFFFLKDNLCDDALYLINGKLIVEDEWLGSISCQWLISSEDKEDFVTIEFQTLNVKSLAF